MVAKGTGSKSVMPAGLNAARAARATASNPTIPVPANQIRPPGGAGNSDEITDEDIKVLYRICMHRAVMVAMLSSKTGTNGDAELYDRVMGKLQHTMDQMGLACI